METFCFNCPQCNQQLEAEEDMHGLVVACPHCGKGIVIPKKKSGAALLKKPQEVAPGGVQPGKAHGADAVNPNFASIQRRLEEQEDESRKDDEQKRRIDEANRRRAMVSNLFRLLAVVVIGGGGLYGWKAWRDAQEAEAAAMKAAEVARKESEEKRLKAEQEQRKAEQEKRRAELDRRKAEHEKDLAERRKLREEQAIARKKRQEEEARLRKERKAAFEAVEKAQEEQRQKFRSLMKSLGGMQADLWRNLSKEKRPGKFDGVFYAVVPDVHSDETIYEIKSHSNGSLDVRTLSRRGEQQSVERDVYEKDVIKNGGLIVVSDKAYIVSPQRNTGNLFLIPSDSDYWSPSEIMLDGLSRMIREFHIDMSGLSFAVSYVMPDKKATVPVEITSFDANVKRSQVIDKVVQHELKSLRPSKTRTKAKVKRPTVVFYDGKILKKGMDGVTYVPRNPSAGNMGRNYFKYADEARRQERLADEANMSASHAEVEFRANISRKIAESLDAGRIKIEMLVYGSGVSR